MHLSPQSSTWPSVPLPSVCLQVDKHIRRLDADLARFEADLKDKMDGSDFESPGGRGLKSKCDVFCFALINCGV